MPGTDPIDRTAPWDERMLAAIQGGHKEHPERPESPWPMLFHLPLVASAGLFGSGSSAWIPLACVWAVSVGVNRWRARRRRARSASVDAFGR